MMISAGRFKAQCLKIMDEVHKTHREVIITKYGKPVAKLVDVGVKSKQSLFGLLKGSVKIKGDIVSSTGEVWDVAQ